MKLSPINKEHLIDAGRYIDHNGISTGNIFNNYYVELPNGKEYPFKQLTREAYKIAHNGKEELDFQSTRGYRNYVENLGLNINQYTQNINFFKEYEISDFEVVAGKKYRKTNEENVRYGKLILPLVKKLNYWASNSKIEDFNVQNDHSWQWSGTFKSYLWIRIYRPDDSKKVFFNIGIDGGGKLYIQLNCQRSNHTGGSTKALSKTKIEAFDAYLAESNYSPKIIEKSNLKNHDWDSLIALTQDFFYQNAALYDELELITKEEAIQDNDRKFFLEPSEAPDSTKSYVNRKRNFKGYDIDWGKKRTVSSKLGTAGEQLVITTEKEKLKKAGLASKAEEVRKAKDGEGYDIFSYSESGEELYIEVKTTKGNSDEPFYLSINEKIFSEMNKHKYVIYRLHNFNNVLNSAKFYKIRGEELNNFELAPTNFEVSKKSIKE